MGRAIWTANDPRIDTKQRELNRAIEEWFISGAVVGNPEYERLSTVRDEMDALAEQLGYRFYGDANRKARKEREAQR